MAEVWDQDRMRKLMVRGFGWCLCVALWTLALLTIYPVEMGAAILPSTLEFPSAKCLHFSVYAFLTVYISWMPLRGWRWLLLAFLSLHAAGTEFGQQFVPGRHGMVSDVLIDHGGLVMGFAMTWKHWLPRLSNCSFSRDAKGSAVYVSRET